MAPKKKVTEDAVSMAKKIREISISEFFAKNRHLLGFDNPMKSLLTTVREAVDNSLDACEEARILPEIRVLIKEIQEARYLVSIEDNGPGIVKSHLPNIFGKLLYGSKFHRLKQSRGQQGIGISAAVMYGQMTTGKAAEIISKVARGHKIHRLSLQIDTKTNSPKVLKDELYNDKHWQEKTSGTKIAIELEGAYKEGKHGVYSYLRQSALSNPHASITYVDPKGKIHEFPRLIAVPPAEPKEIKPHPLGIELGTLMQFMHEAKNQSLVTFLKSEFSRVSDETAAEIALKAGLNPHMLAAKAGRTEAESVFNAIQHVKLMAPPTNCLSPLNEDAIIKALYWFYVESQREKSGEEEESPQVEVAEPAPAPVLAKKKGKKSSHQEEFNFTSTSAAESQVLKIDKKIETLTDTTEGAVLDEEQGFFVTAVTRPPSVYRGNPFQIEVGLFYGRSLPADNLVEVFRFANRVPLQYQAAACAMTKAVISAPWKLYGLQQSRGALPVGPMVIMVSISSVWVPYTSESKEAVAHYPEIVKELRLGLMEAGRRLQRFINRRKRHSDEAKKRSYIEKYLDPIRDALREILGAKAVSSEEVEEDLKYILEKSRAHKTVKMGKHRIED
ncbi:MAG TPA: DNA topoisomerase VI subunit B [Myxococcota bacterium]|nr:DNA topoisomerase VI subunit B [Myxococcota bacterium]